MQAADFLWDEAAGIACSVRLASELSGEHREQVITFLDVCPAPIAIAVLRQARKETGRFSVLAAELPDNLLCAACHACVEQGTYGPSLPLALFPALSLPLSLIHI